MASRTAAGGSDRGTARIIELLAPVVDEAGYDLEQVSVGPAGRKTLVRVVVDRDGGVSLDDVAVLSRRISAALDRAEGADGAFGPAPYTLEVSSPGVDRPLTAPRHWRRSRGRLVRAQLLGAGGEPAGEVAGRVAAADDGGVLLEGPDGGQDRYGYDRLGPGRIQLEFSRPGGGPR